MSDILVWNDVRVCKWWRTCHFWVKNIPLKLCFKVWKIIEDHPQEIVVRCCFIWYFEGSLLQTWNSMCQMLNVLCHHFLVCFPVCNCCALSRKTLCYYWRFQMLDEKLIINLKQGWRHWCLNDTTANADALKEEGGETTLLIRYWYIYFCLVAFCVIDIKVL